MKKPTMTASIFKPIGTDNACLTAIDYKEVDIFFGQTVEFVPLNDFENIQRDFEQRELLLRAEIKKLKKEKLDKVNQLILFHNENHELRNCLNKIQNAITQYNYVESANVAGQT